MQQKWKLHYKVNLTIQLELDISSHCLHATLMKQIYYLVNRLEYTLHLHTKNKICGNKSNIELIT